MTFSKAVCGFVEGGSLPDSLLIATASPIETSLDMPHN
jgi:hypothetical protein